jgi:hypothetical protein
LQWVTSVKILICEYLRKVSVVRCEINLLRRAVHCKGWYYGSCGGREWFVILGIEMGMKAFFGGLKVSVGIWIITTVCKKATIWYLRIKN